MLLAMSDMTTIAEENRILRKEMDALRSTNKALSNQVDFQSEQIEALEEEIRLWRHRRFGASSEKFAGMRGLFDEAESDAREESESPEAASDAEKPPRKKRRKRSFPQAWERKDVHHDLTDEEKVCSCGCGMHRIGEDVSEELEFIPAKFRVLRHIRYKYGCRGCQESMKTAPAPARILPGSMAGPGLLAHIAVSKYSDAMPLSRQEGILNRAGADLPANTLARWMIRIAEELKPLLKIVEKDLLSGATLYMDETTVQVLNEAGRAATSKSYMWCMIRADGPVIVRFRYSPSRSASVATDLLGGFSGRLMTDAYPGYDSAQRQTGFTLHNCWSHGRRGFADAEKASKKKGRLIGEGLKMIRKLYRIEKSVSDSPPEMVLETRLRESKPVVEKLRAWLDLNRPKVPPSGALGRAMGYLDNHWDKLVRFLEDGRMPIDNNACENAIRPFCVGRKNWTFSSSVRGAQASADIYSLIQTAVKNGREPYAWLRDTLTRMPACSTEAEYRALLPYTLP